MLPGKLAFITGAGGGIGRSICRLMAREGATIVAADININNVQSTIAELTGKGHKSYQLDVSNEESVYNVLKQVFIDYNAPPTIVVNAAGITRDNFMLKLSLQDFESVFNVNVKGTFLVTQTICRELVEKNLTGSIVNIGSAATQRCIKGFCNYLSSKAAIEVFSKTVALEMARHNIRCNTVLPGITITPMIDILPEEVKEHFKSTIPMNRFADSDEIAEVVTFLASEKSSYITGSSIVVSGGL